MEQTNNQIILTECPSCGSPDFKNFLTTHDYFLSKEQFSLDRCAQCGLVFTNPIPRPEYLSGYYDSPDYLSHTASNQGLYGWIYRQLRNINLAYKYRIIERFKNKGNALDIGQGTGEFLYYLRQKGWEVTGIEPNQQAREFAAVNYGLKVYGEESISEIPAGSFDLITMWHVLEHVPNLRQRMTDVFRLVRHDGFLIIAVPNLDSPDFDFYGEYWAALDVPRHLYHFSNQSMRRLLETSGLEVLETFPLTLDAYYVSLLSERYKGNKFPYLKGFINGMRSNLKAISKKNHSSMVFVARPK